MTMDLDLEILGGRLCFDWRPLTDELPSHVRMRLEDHLRAIQADLDRVEDQPMIERLADAHAFECILDPEGRVWSWPADPRLQMDPPDNWHRITLVNKDDSQW